tara:strand:- start:326 stop:517 length:192 start_codon:yes stop_codon:yes gene_type:complete
MRYLAVLWVLVIVGCGLFNPAKYNPNPTPKPTVEAVKDSIRVDTIRLTNGVDHIIMLDTVKVK